MLIKISLFPYKYTASFYNEVRNSLVTFYSSKNTFITSSYRYEWDSPEILMSKNDSENSNDNFLYIYLYFHLFNTQFGLVFSSRCTHISVFFYLVFMKQHKHELAGGGGPCGVSQSCGFWLHAWFTVVLQYWCKSLYVASASP